MFNACMTFKRQNVFPLKETKSMTLEVMLQNALITALMYGDAVNYV